MRRSSIPAEELPSMEAATDSCAAVERVLPQLGAAAHLYSIVMSNNKRWNDVIQQSVLSMGYDRRVRSQQRNDHLLCCSTRGHCASSFSTSRRWAWLCVQLSHERAAQLHGNGPVAVCAAPR